MAKKFNNHWTYKILAAFFGVIIITGAIHVLAMNLSLATAFERHIGRMGGGIQGMMGGFRGSSLYQSLMSAVNESMLVSAIIAFFIAGIAALVISQRITKPVKSLTKASQKIARGDYSYRISEKEIPSDELGQLAVCFNQMAKELESIEGMRRRLIGDISHELRTPLTAIKGSMEGLIDGVLPSNQSTFQQIYREADRLQRLVEDLQELSRVDSGTFTLNKKPVDIEEVLKIATAPFTSSFKKKGVSLESQLDQDLPKISVDADRIQQVLQNLLGNALRFTPTKGHVIISIRKESSKVIFSIGDDGVGIEKEHLSHIFERFYQADKSRSRANGGGSGIGLSIAKSLVEAHGGEIHAESVGKGKGSTFSFTIPA